jgi:cell wall-associated NlpC family hydrolase
MNWVNKYIGIPYQDKGRTIQGCDCWGLVYLVLLEQWGVRVPTYTEDYTNTKKDHQGEIHDLVHRERQMWIPIQPGQEQPGDVVNLRIMAKDCHTGIITEPGEMLHTMMGHNSALESYRHSTWRNRIAGFFRHEQLTG